jgi:hypothetical protein
MHLLHRLSVRTTLYAGFAVALLLAVAHGDVSKQVTPTPSPLRLSADAQAAM